MNDIHFEDSLEDIANGKEDYDRRPMRPVVLPPFLKEIRPTLEQAFPGRVERIRLFGSRAKGNYRDDSDWDIAAFIKGYDPDTESRALVRCILPFLARGHSVSIVGLGKYAHYETILVGEIERDGVEI